ncbi:hypothetical protein Taro_006953, partial [Colocasia esculenta]|nr:hypothetical protein [Colocasia esculenta]
MFPSVPHRPSCTAVVAWPWLAPVGVVGLAWCGPVLLVVFFDVPAVPWFCAVVPIRGGTGPASAVDRRRQFMKNQKVEGSDYMHLSTGALLLSTGAGLPELLIFGLVASVDRVTPAVDKQCLGRTDCSLT